MNRCRRSLASPLLAALVLLAFPAAGCSQAGVAIVRLLTKTGGKTVAKAASKQVAAKSAGAAAGKAAVATEASVALRPVVTRQADDLVDAAVPSRSTRAQAVDPPADHGLASHVTDLVDVPLEAACEDDDPQPLVEDLP